MNITRRAFFAAPLALLLGRKAKPDVWAILDDISGKYPIRAGLTKSVFATQLREQAFTRGLLHPHNFRNPRLFNV